MAALPARQQGCVPAALVSRLPGRSGKPNEEDGDPLETERAETQGHRPARARAMPGIESEEYGNKINIDVQRNVQRPAIEQPESRENSATGASFAVVR
jgi:hypothetical protein